MKERRLSRRLSANFPAALKAGPITTHGTIRQISDSGMLFECIRHFEGRDNICFDLRAFDAEPPVTVKGRIVYKVYHNDGDHGQDTTLRYGVKFTSLDNYLHKNYIEKVMVFLAANQTNCDSNPAMRME